MPSTYRGTKLKPCPHCGERKLLRVGLLPDPHVACGRCNATAFGMPQDELGNGGFSRAGAVRRWNTRIE